MHIFSELARLGKFNVDLTQQFTAQFGETFLKALEYLQVEGRKVRKNVFSPSNLTIWTIEGTDHHYIVFPEIYCQCQNFQMEYIYRKKKFGMCKHLLAQKLAEILNQFEISKNSDSDWVKWKKQNIVF
jgi:predicted nucleic acid-binding Zn finger protein